MLGISFSIPRERGRKDRVGFDNFYTFLVFNLVVINLFNAGYFLWWVRAAEDEEARRKRLLLAAVALPTCIAFSYLMAWAVAGGA